MSTPAELLAQYTNQAQMSSFFTDNIGIISVKTYGAVGDGITDDTLAVQNAINAAVANGNKTLFFPHGTYKVTTLTNYSTLEFVGDNSSFIGGTYTIGQNWADLAAHLTDYVSFTRFGCVGDGITDNTAFFNTAKAYLVSKGGGTLLIPQGTFVGDFIIDSPNIHICGMGKGLTILKKKTSAINSQCVLITADDCSVSNLTVKGLTVSSYLSNEYGIYCHGTDDLTRINDIVIDQVEIYDVGSYGIFTSFCNTVKVIKHYIHNVGYAGVAFESSNFCDAINGVVDTVTPGINGNAYGIYYSNTAGNIKCYEGVCAFNKIRNIPLWEALDTHGSERIKFVNNDISNCMLGINIGRHNTDNTAPHYCEAIGNIIDAGIVTTVGRGIGGGGSSTEKAKGLVVANNIIKGHGSATDTNDGAVMFKYTTGLTIADNYIEGAITGGITMGTDNIDVNIHGNNINGITAGASSSGGIRFRDVTTGYCGDNIINATDQFGIYLASLSMPGLEFGRNRITTTNASPVVGMQYAGRGVELYGSATLDPTSLVDGAGVTLTIFIAGALLGDVAQVSAPYDLQGISVTAYVSAVNTVSIRIQNESGATVDLASGTWKVKVTRI
ncbi:MAG: glycosyl hydrolase family 28-related protein [Caulobacteraceae bacterium]